MLSSKQNIALTPPLRQELHRWAIEFAERYNANVAWFEQKGMNDLPDGYFTEDHVRVYRQLVERVPDCGTICELGVWQGRSLCSIADIILRKNLKVFAVDTFAGSESEEGMQAAAKENNIFAHFSNNTAAFGIYPATLHMNTNRAAGMFASEVFDLVFIDAEHTYEAVSNDIANWLPKIKTGGLLAGHDYMTVEGVTKAVNELPGFWWDCSVWWHDKQ